MTLNQMTKIARINRAKRIMTELDVPGSSIASGIQSRESDSESREKTVNFLSRRLLFVMYLKFVENPLKTPIVAIDAKIPNTHKYECLKTSSHEGFIISRNTEFLFITLSYQIKEFIS